MKAAIHKYHKGRALNNNTAIVSDDDVPLHEMSKVKKISGPPNGKVNGVNGHNGAGHDAMQVDDKPLVNGKKRKKAKSESESDDNPLLASSPSKVPPTSSSGSGREPNGRVNGRRTKAVSYKDDTSDDDDVPLASQATVETPTPRPSRKKAKIAPESESDDDLPLAASSSVAATPSRKRVSLKQEESDDASGGEPDAPAPKKKGKKANRESVTKKPSTKRKSQAADEGSEPPKTVSKRKGKEKEKEKEKEKKPPASPRKKAKKEQDEEEVFKWWESPDAATQGVEGEGVAPSPADVLGDGTVKWKTLVHSGVLFPPPYSPLPSDVKMKYDGKEVNLPLESEEVAMFFAKLLGSAHVEDPVFQTNFFRDFTGILKQHPPRDGTNITEFEKCDFRKIYDHLQAEKEAKKNMNKEQKKAEKEKTMKEEEKYKTCLLDGRKEKVGNFRVEPPGLFLGRGEHPKKGSLKHRLRPENIIINIGEGAPIPVPNMPGKWKSVTHDNTVTWLANWKENINGNFKYVFLAASSSLKGQSDMNKFEKARELKKYVDTIRKDYQAELRSKLMADRQRATAVYFIDKLALRAGNEKGEDEADTVGCCSLRCEHVTMEPPNNLVFDFLGKDSIRYFNTVQVEAQVFKNIRIFKESKNDDDALFDRVTTGGLNKYLQGYMKGLTAKVFRTYNASITLQQQLDENTPGDVSEMEKLAAYNKANRMVAILCNHQRAVSKNHGESMAKMNDKLRGLKYDRMKLRHALFKLEPKKKKVSQYADLESDLDDEFIERWEGELEEKEIEKAKKKFTKDNETREADGEKPQKESVLEETIEGIREEFKRLAKERGTNKADLKRARPTEKIEEQIEALDTKIKNFKIQMDDKEEGKQVALGTSKINYLDPRITAAWCARHNVTITKIFSKSLVQKFPWAMGVSEDWKF